MTRLTPPPRVTLTLTILRSFVEEMPESNVDVKKRCTVPLPMKERSVQASVTRGYDT
jgi:hypothetical protein